MALLRNFLYLTVFISLCIISHAQETSEEPPLVMTTIEPIDQEQTSQESNDDSTEDLNDSSAIVCSNFTTCSDCNSNQTCQWIACDSSADAVTQFPLLTKEESCVLTTATLPTNCTTESCHLVDPCSNYTSCENCTAADNVCSWLACVSALPVCMKEAAEGCEPIPCNGTITTTPLPITTTDVPTTTTPDNITTTPVPPTTTPVPPTSTPVPPTPTDAPSTSTPAPPTTTTPAPVPAAGGFSAGSFFGGITLTLAMIGIGLGGYKFYKMKYDVNYRTL